MSPVKPHGHPSLPPPALHAGFSAHQSKSHVLAGVQDAYWSDDDADDAECPLCLEEMDISDLNFKPCVCGYQICRFCWHHIKQNLNGRCPACRREYTDEAVQFRPIPQEDHKRLTQQKKQRERERKELDALGRRHLVNVRVVQRNVVYVVGIGPKFAKEELIPTLRSNDYFGQYGKISKMILVKRTLSNGGAPILGLYITYHRREDAARCIATVDGAPSPGGGRELMRASYGTTKYCIAFLRGVSCSDNTCMNLHEWGDEKDCFTKEDLTTLKHTIKDTENRTRSSKRGDAVLPRAAAWGTKASSASVPPPGASHAHSSSTTPMTRPSRRSGQRQARNANTETRPSRPQHDRKSGTTAVNTKTPSVTSSSRPPTPAVGLPSQPPPVPPDVKPLLVKEQLPQASPAPSAALESDVGPEPQDAPSPVRPLSIDSAQFSTLPNILGVSDIPPGLFTPPGLKLPRPSAHVVHAIQPVHSTYQISTAAQALLDDVKSRRENAPTNATANIFPDLDRTLRMISGEDDEFGGFSFNLDPKLAGEGSNSEIALLNPEVDATIPFTGNFMDTFPELRPTQSQKQCQSPSLYMAPSPGIPYPQNSSCSVFDPFADRATSIDRQPAAASNYVGSFNPFGECNEDSTSQSQGTSTGGLSLPNEDRKMSRFGFARGRQSNTATSSPVHTVTPLSMNDGQQSFSGETNSLAVPQQWTVDRGYSVSPPAQHSQAVQPPLQQCRFHPFDNNISVGEAQLREFLHISRERANVIRNSTAGSEQQRSSQYALNQPFHDPAIMSARLASPSFPMTTISQPIYPKNVTGAGGIQASASVPLEPPPGLGFPPAIRANHAAPVSGTRGNDEFMMNSSRLNPQLAAPQPAPLSPVLSPEDFPALVSSTAPRTDLQTIGKQGSGAENIKEQAKSDRKAAAVQRALERQKAAQEKAASRIAEKARIAQEKAAEKERLSIMKGEEGQLSGEVAEKETEQHALEKAEVPHIAKQSDQRTEPKTKVRTSKLKRAAALEKAGRAGRPPQTLIEEQTNPPPKPVELAADQPPILSKMPKKNRPATRPIKIPKDMDMIVDEASAVPSATTSETPVLMGKSNQTVVSSPNDTVAQSPRMVSPIERASLVDLFDELDAKNPYMDLPNHPFFDSHRINPAAKMPLEYGPLVHALSTLSVGGGSFASTMPSGSIDNAVSSFQQLLETLTQTISDLLRLLPRTTWDDSSSFDDVLRDMLRGDDFLDETGDDSVAKEDEVAALTLALERRARWMEVQLSKLEELHRDINTAAVRAVLAFNDSGWDRRKTLPHVGNTLRRFDRIGMVEENGRARPMTVDELEKKLVVAKEATVFVETELREAMEKMQVVRPVGIDDY